MATVATDPVDPQPPAQKQKKDRTHYLYVLVIVAVVAGAVLGLLAPEFAQTLKPVGTAFIALIKMMIAPIIFCTIVLASAPSPRRRPSARSAAWPWPTSWRCPPWHWASAWWWATSSTRARA